MRRGMAFGEALPEPVPLPVPERQAQGGGVGVFFLAAVPEQARPTGYHKEIMERDRQGIIRDLLDLRMRYLNDRHDPALGRYRVPADVFATLLTDPHRDRYFQPSVLGFVDELMLFGFKVEERGGLPGLVSLEVVP